MFQISFDISVGVWSLELREPVSVNSTDWLWYAFVTWEMDYVRSWMVMAQCACLLSTLPCRALSVGCVSKKKLCLSWQVHSCILPWHECCPDRCWSVSVCICKRQEFSGMLDTADASDCMVDQEGNSSRIRAEEQQLETTGLSHWALAVNTGKVCPL